MNTFYVVRVIKNGELKMSLDYPKDFPVPNVGDELAIKDEQGIEYSGTVAKKCFKVGDYRELKIDLMC